MYMYVNTQALCQISVCPNREGSLLPCVCCLCTAQSPPAPTSWILQLASNLAQLTCMAQRGQGWLGCAGDVLPGGSVGPTAQRNMSRD